MATNDSQQHHGIKLNFVRELYRLIPIIVAAGLLLGSDKGSAQVVLYMVGILLLVAAVSHILRKVLFPYLDLKLFVDKALEQPTASGMVFLGMSFIIGMMIYSATGLLK